MQYKKQFFLNAFNAENMDFYDDMNILECEVSLISYNKETCQNEANFTHKDFTKLSDN